MGEFFWAMLIAFSNSQLNQIAIPAELYRGIRKRAGAKEIN
jgi:hypothetical protein